MSKTGTVRSALQAGAFGSRLTAAGWMTLLLALIVVFANVGMPARMDDLAGPVVLLGYFALVLWMSGSIPIAVGWLGLRSAVGGHARAVALTTMLAGASYLIVPLLEVWGVPGMWQVGFVALASWHGVAAWWFVKARGGVARVASIAHGLTALGATTMLVGLVVERADVIATTGIATSLTASVGHIAAGRYMALMRPLEDLYSEFD